MGYINAFYLLATLAISSIASAQACTKVCLDNCSGAAWARWGPKWGCLESLPKCNMKEIRRKQKNGGRWTPCRNGRERYDLLDDEGYNAQDLVLLPNQVDSDFDDEDFSDNDDDNEFGEDDRNPHERAPPVCNDLYSRETCDNDDRCAWCDSKRGDPTRTSGCREYGNAKDLVIRLWSRCDSVYLKLTKKEKFEMYLKRVMNPNPHRRWRDDPNNEEGPFRKWGPRPRVNRL